MRDAVETLKNIISNLRGDNRLLAKWLEHGAWYDDVEGFLKRWHDDDLDKNEDGMTDIQKAYKLVQELKVAYKRNKTQLFIARRLLEDVDSIPKRFKEEPMLAWYYLEEMTDEVLNVIK